MNRIFFFTIIGLWFTIQSNAQFVPNYFQNTEISPSTCGEDNGSISFDEPPFWINFEWSNGSTEPILENLSPGSYTVSGENENGCIETIVYNVPNIDCTFEFVVESSSKRRECAIVSFVFYLNGLAVPLEYLNFNWTVTIPIPISPGTTTYMTNNPKVYIYPTSSNNTLGGVANINLEVSLISDDTIPCCEFNEDLFLTLRDCRDARSPPVYIYKSNFSNPQNEGYVPGIIELLVVGEEGCQENFDLRGFIIDDNNGELIKPNSAGLLTGEGVNVNNGYIKFSNNSNWAKVPVGSIITIYNPNHKLNMNDGISSQDDPTDSDGNLNYIVSVTDVSYFEGYSSTWSVDENMFTYDGASTSLSWSLIAPMGGAGVIQVRYPEGDYCHGVAFGKTEDSEVPNYFQLYLSETEYEYGRIQMNHLSHSDISAFDISVVTGAFEPGMSNSPEMTNYLNYLRNCDDGGLGLATNENNTEITIKPESLVNTRSENIRRISDENILNVYPNPFKDLLNIEYKSTVQGEGILILFNSVGKEVYREQLICKTKSQSKILDFGSSLSDGLYLLQFHPPEGEVINKRVMLIYNY